MQRFKALIITIAKRNIEFSQLDKQYKEGIKKGKKTGNWVTEESKKFDTPNECYNWAKLKIKYKEL